MPSLKGWEKTRLTIVFLQAFWLFPSFDYVLAIYLGYLNIDGSDKIV